MIKIYAIEIFYDDYWRIRVVMAKKEQEAARCKISEDEPAFMLRCGKTLSEILENLKECLNAINENFGEIIGFTEDSISRIFDKKSEVEKRYLVVVKERV